VNLLGNTTGGVRANRSFAAWLQAQQEKKQKRKAGKAQI